MRVSVPSEVKNNEFRVAITPAGVHELVVAGHEVFVQAGAGLGSSITDAEYQSAGAKITPDAKTTWESGDMVLKVKEPIEQEYGFLREGLVLFTYLHLAADLELTQQLVANKVTAIAYETVQLPNRQLPLLAPMSEVAGRMSIQAAATHLEKTHGGIGVLMAGVPGVSPAKVVILGAGVVGRNALQIAVGMGADVCIFDRDIDRLRQIDQFYGNRVRTFYSDSLLIEQEVSEADVVIGAVLLPGGAAPKLVTRKMIKKMKSGTVVVDVAIDQGGCFETSKPTTHADPTFMVDGILHYCVANMPGAVARTSTFALTNATYPYVEALANRGVVKALSIDHHLRNGLSVHKGVLTSKPVAQAQGLDFALAEELLAA